MVKGKEQNSLKELVKRNKVTIVIILIILLILLLVFGTKIWLYLNFILGNDIVVKLEVNQEDFSLVKGEEEDIVFEAKVTTNPFCTAECNSVFEDISNNRIIEQNSFILRPGIPLKKEYKLEVSGLGEGQLLYRFNLDCKSKENMLCHTKEEYTSRSILVTVEYTLSEEERILKEELKQNLENLKERVEQIYRDFDRVNRVADKIDDNISTDEYNSRTDSVNKSISKHIDDLFHLKSIWNTQDYNLLNEEYVKLNPELINTSGSVERLYDDLSADILLYNNIINDLSIVQKRMDELSKIFLIEESQAIEVNRVIKEFNSTLNFFKERNTISQKEKARDIIINITDKSYFDIKRDVTNDAVKKTIETDINYETLCRLNLSCIRLPSIEKRANQTNFDLKVACDDIDGLRELYLEINQTAEEGTDESSAELISIREGIISDYIERLPENAVNSYLISTIITKKGFAEGGYSVTNSSSFIAMLIANQQESCEGVATNISGVEPVDVEKIEINETKLFDFSLDLEFEDLAPRCCVFGECNDCCISEECNKDPSTFPILLLHGHALNKDTVADYSLDAFNKIQKKLEEDGYLNAGAISLYNLHDREDGVLGLSGVPISIKASYYFDMFKEPQNYVVVQTKSENIDTYAVRLNELVDTVLDKTGKPKVVMVTHSMGGLVARRYIQIFGSEKVDKLIMIASPNKGIRGDVADYCPIIGEKLECGDMNEDSLFMNKLNRAELPDIEIYNIIGTGCKMKKEMGDGIVFEQNAKLDGVKDYIINGTCNGLVSLHAQLLNIERYPKVYGIINQSLKGF